MAANVTPTGASAATDDGRPRRSLSTAAARQLATTTKTVPQMRGITPRWLLRILPWVQVAGGTYRVNRRLVLTVGDGRITFLQEGAHARVIPQELRELAVLRDFADEEVLDTLAGRFVQRDLAPGQTIVEAGQTADEICLIAHGKVEKLGTGHYGEALVLAVLGDGDHFSYHTLGAQRWPFTVRAASRSTVLVLTRERFDEVAAGSPALQAHLERFRAGPGRPHDRHGQADVELAAGHRQEDQVPGTYVDYDRDPREYELSVAQTVLRIHTRVADLFNDPMNQTGQQLRLTIEALRERQEHEIVNNADFGLLPNVAFSQRLHTRTGPPTPDDLDELLSRRRKTRYFLAHPRAIAAFGQECNRRGIYPQPVRLHGRTVHAWRDVPLLPCNKIPLTESGTTSIMAMRVGQDDQGVVGLHQTGIPDEVQPSLSARFMGIDEKGIISYLVSAYFSAAILIPDALGVLEDVETGRREAAAGAGGAGASGRWTP
ncbi:MAG TPA: family 2B encapsulin nanocompartment shell protein [Egibacteraceae bacterium]|jgi:hypothetical protein|nr:family 2B encapsulin nanocompartment shell protein [Egibacteraceae bacterium]